MINGVHQARGLEATGCHPRSFRGGEVRTGVVGVSPRGRGQSVSTQPLGEPLSAGNEEAWNMLMAKSPSEDHAEVSATAAAAILASATDVDDGNAR